MLQAIVAAANSIKAVARAAMAEIELTLSAVQSTVANGVSTLFRQGLLSTRQAAFVVAKPAHMKTVARCALWGASISPPPGTAALRTPPRQLETLNEVGGSACRPIRPSNNAALSGKTSSRSVGGFLVKPLVFIAVLALIVKINAQEVGEIAPRTAPQGTEAAMSVLQNARNAVQKRLANIAAQADPLAEAVAAYKANPTPETALKLLHREAVVAGIGAKESESIASEASTVARSCAGLSAQTQAAAEMLRPGLDKATRARVEHAATRNTGFNELKEVHRTLVERGVTNELSMSAAEKRKVAMLLRLTGAADLSERFLKMEVGATEAVIARLNAMSEQFAARQRNFQDLAEAYRLHAASFKTVGGSVAQVARLIEINQRFDAEAKTAAELETELARVDDVLGKTFDSLPDDFAPALATGDSGGSGSGSPGLWTRFLRFLHLADQPEPVVTKAETEGGSR